MSSAGARDRRAGGEGDRAVWFWGEDLWLQASRSKMLVDVEAAESRRRSRSRSGASSLTWGRDWGRRQGWASPCLDYNGDLL